MSRRARPQASRLGLCADKMLSLYMNFFFKKHLLLPVIFFVLLSCNNSTSGSVTEMEFTVDSSLVDVLVRDTALHIEYRVPGSWTEIEAPEEALKQVQAGNMRVSKMLQNTEGSVVFSLTDVRNVADTTFRNLDENYKTILNPSGAWNDIERAEFNFTGFAVKQYVMMRPGQAFFKMFFSEHQRTAFQLDYSIMIDSSYALHTKTLESIVGSLKHDH